MWIFLMQLTQAPRASAILYNILVGCADSRPWLLPANICPIVPITFLKAQVPFEFVDISPATLHMDLAQAEELLGRKKIGGLLYAHTYGEPYTPLEFFSEIKSLHPSLIILDDRCLCVPDLEPIYSADVILYSTGYAKIAELNSGGYAFLDDNFQYRPANLPFNPIHHDELERSYKRAVEKQEKFVYRDSDWLKIDPTFPAWYDYSSRVELRLKGSLAHRAVLNRVYETCLPKDIQLPQSYQTWRFNIRVKNKTRILTAIFDAGLFASSHYASLAGIMADGYAPFAGALAGEVINLFNDEHFNEEMAQKTCEIILRNL
jgi:hypothetical protein